MPTKYKLYVSGQLKYSFVTTKLKPDECINVLKEKVVPSQYKNTTSYKIMKVEDGKDILIFKGNIKATN